MNFKQITAIARHYRAVVCKDHKLVIEELKRKPLEKDHARVRVYACAINELDKVQFKQLQTPFVPGHEVCGELLEVNPDSKLKKNSRVIAINPKLTGGLAEEMTTTTSNIWPVSTSMSYEKGASLIDSYATGVLALVRRGEVKEGQTILIVGAGRVGLAVLDLAVNVYRCRVIGLCERGQSEVMRERGAFKTVVGGQDVVKEIGRVTGGEGVGLVIDTGGGGGGGYEGGCSPEAKIIHTSSPPKSQSLGFSVTCLSLDEYRRKQFDVYRETVGQVINLAKEGLISPIKAKHYPLEKVKEAFEGEEGVVVVDVP